MLHRRCQHSRTLSMLVGAFALGFASPNSAFATHTFCATERTPDGFMNLREGPGTQYKVLGKILTSDLLDVATENAAMISDDYYAI